MGRVFVHLQNIGAEGDESDFIGTVTSDDDETIEISMLSRPDLLDMAPHEIVGIVADQDPAIAKVVGDAVAAGIPVFVNDEKSAMDSAAYGSRSASTPR